MSLASAHRLVLGVERAHVAARAEDLLADHRAVSGSPVQMVGSTQAPLRELAAHLGMPPPVTTVAPSSRALR